MGLCHCLRAYCLYCWSTRAEVEPPPGRQGSMMMGVGVGSLRLPKPGIYKDSESKVIEALKLSEVKICNRFIRRERFCRSEERILALKRENSECYYWSVRWKSECKNLFLAIIIEKENRKAIHS